MYMIWVRDSWRAKWRAIKTREFSDWWEANQFIDKCMDLGKHGEAVPVPVGETVVIEKSTHGV